MDEASDGTLFLDEIGEMNIDLQAKLLRVLETGEFYRVGESKARKVNIRLIAATNRDLEKSSTEGSFRKDLFYRLSVFSISLPALKSRKDDIELLARYFVEQYSVKTNKRGLEVKPSFIKALESHPWKGNIRELKNIIERSVILSDDTLTDAVLPSDFDVDDQGDSYLLADMERNHIARALKHTGGNKTQTAKLLGIALTTLYQKIKDYNL